MAATTEQRDQQQHQQHTDVAQNQNPFDHYVLTAKHKDSVNNSKDTREVRFVETKTSQDCSKSPVAHPKNKVLKRKNTPATLPKVDKICTRDQASGMGAFAEEEVEEDDAEVEEGDNDDDDDNGLNQAAGGVM